MYNAQDLAFQIWRRISTRRKFPIDDAMMPTCRYDCIKFSLMALAAAAYAIDVAKGGNKKEDSHNGGRGNSIIYELYSSVCHIYIQ